jgi:hypothetical protein
MGGAHGWDLRDLIALVLVLVLENLGVVWKHLTLFCHGANESRLTDTFLGRTFEHEQEDDGQNRLARKHAEVTVPMPEHESYPHDHKSSDSITDEKRERHSGAGQTAIC